jgi:hypothetical protein
LEQLVSYSTGVKGESVGWHGCERGGCGAEGGMGKRWSVNRPYRMGLSRIAGRTLCGRMTYKAHAMRPYGIVPKKIKKEQFRRSENGGASLESLLAKGESNTDMAEDSVFSGYYHYRGKIPLIKRFRKNNAKINTFLG